jgi:hypothetical protein
MALKLGSQDVSKLYLGSTLISKQYLGAVEVLNGVTPALPVSLPVAPVAFYGTGQMAGYAGSCAKVTKSTLATQNIGFAGSRLDMADDTANTVTKLSSILPQSNVSVLGYSSGGAGVSYYVDRKVETVAGAFASGTLTGGVWENGNGYSEMFALVIFPRALTPAEMSQVGLALEAIVAPNISPTIGVIFNGDSLTAGQGSSTAPANGLGWWWNEPRQFQLALPDPNKIMLFNFGQPSEPITQLNADKARIFPALMAAYPTITKWIVRHHGGINDLRAGSTDTQIITAISQLNAYTKSLGMKTFASTVVAQGNLAPWTAQMETYRQSVNASVLANWATYADGLIDYTSLPQMQDPTNLTYFVSDQLHHTSAGYQAEAALSASIMAPFI